MHRGRTARVKVPRSDAEKALARAKRAVNVAKQQAVVAALLRALQGRGVPLSEWAREVPFHGPKTSHPWRFDLACARYKVAVEIDGGSYSGKPCMLCGERPGGRHSRGGREAERLKLNTAAAYGWVVLSFTTTAITRETDQCAALITQTLTIRGG